ncbi:MAG: hydroxymethylbilane synthase, partial [Verrucomicrobiota bacterium]
ARESALDLLITRGEKSLQELPPRAMIATGSPRRVAQILGTRPDLQLVDIRGNIDTRLRKLRENASWSGIILAEAGLNRLRPDLQGLVATPLNSVTMLPAPGQGSLGIQMRENDSRIDLLKNLDCFQTRLHVIAERAFLQALGGGCAQPIAALAQNVGDELQLEGFWSDGKTKNLRDKVVGSPQNPHALGTLLAKKIISSSETP